MDICMAKVMDNCMGKVVNDKHMAKVVDDKYMARVKLLEDEDTVKMLSKGMAKLLDKKEQGQGQPCEQ